MGLLRTSYMHGEIYYRTRGSIVFFAMKTLRRLAEKPLVAGGISMLWGYLHALLRGRESLVTPAEGRCYRRLLTQRLKEMGSRILAFK